MMTSAPAAGEPAAREAAGRRLRIALVVHDYHRSGGHSRYVAELAERFCREHEVHLFVNRIEGPVPPEIRVHHVPALRLTALTTVLSFLAPASLSLRGEYDIVHAQGLCCTGADVITAHICNRAWYRSQQETERGVTPRQVLFDRLVSPLERLAFRGRAHVIAVSRAVADDLRRYYGRGDRTTVIYHGVDLERFSPENRARLRGAARERLGLAPGEPAFLFVGDMRKGAAVNIQALRGISRGRMVFVSRSDPERYRALASELGVEDRVLFCAPSDEIEEYFAAADVFVFPTPYDAFGMVISEAMGCGLPVVTSRTAGAAELIAEGENGLLLRDLSDPEEVARYLQSLIDAPETAERLGRAARRRVEALSWDVVARETMEVYEMAIRERGE